MTTVNIDCVKERNNFITVSDFFSVTPNTIGKYSAKPVFEWSLLVDSPSEWVKVNALTSVNLSDFSISYNGTFSSLSVEISDDDFNWTPIFSGEFESDEELTGLDVNFKFIRFRFIDLVAPFYLTNMTVNIWDNYEREDFISFLSESFVPAKIRENSPLMEDFIKTYLEMLEDNTMHDRTLIDTNFYMHALSGLDSANIYAINTKAINVHALDGIQPTGQQMGEPSAVSGKTVEFAGTTNGTAQDSLFIWDFGDELGSTIDNPNLVKVLSIVEPVRHTYSTVGKYIVRLIEQRKDGIILESVRAISIFT